MRGVDRGVEWEYVGHAGYTSRLSNSGADVGPRVVRRFDVEAEGCQGKRACSSRNIVTII